MQTRKWQDQNGNDRYTTEIVLQKFRGELKILDSRKDGAESSPADEEKNIDRGRYGDQSAGSDYDRNFDRDLDDEIPF